MNAKTLHNEWASRPDDQRFLTLDDLQRHVEQRKRESWTLATEPKNIRAVLHEGDGAPQLRIRVEDPSRDDPVDLTPTHWSFGQFAAMAGASSGVGYLRTMPAELAAINLQWGLEHRAVREEALLYAQSNGANVARCWTSTTYGRIYDLDVCRAVQKVNADGRWKVPAASYATKNPKRATTLYASDRDLFVFLCDPDRAIEIPGASEPLFRGFIASNSEVGARTMTLIGFLYNRVCDNRTIWGLTNVQELAIRHTSGAPDRFASEGGRMLRRYSEESPKQIVNAITKAQETLIGDQSKKDDSVLDWLKARGFTSALAKASVAAAKAEEGEARTLWQIVQGVTAHARSITHTDERVKLETQAGKLLAAGAK
jgi:hypothetical protein